MSVFLLEYNYGNLTCHTCAAYNAAATLSDLLETTMVSRSCNSWTL